MAHLKSIYDELELEKQSVGTEDAAHAVDHASGGGQSHAERGEREEGGGASSE